MKRFFVELEEFIFELRFGNSAYCEYYSLKYELGCGNLFNFEYDKWYSKEFGV